MVAVCEFTTLTPAVPVVLQILIVAGLTVKLVAGGIQTTVPPFTVELGHQFPTCAAAETTPPG